MTFELKTDIAAPEARRAGRPTAQKYPFEKMTVGTSFFVPTEPEGSNLIDPVKPIPDQLAAIEDRLRAAANRWRKAHDQKAVEFRVAACAHPDTGLPAVGVWRVA